MVETQIHAGGSSAAPLIYNVASTEEFTLLAVNATFDGAGASSAWLPALEVVSDSGQVIARHITGETVAAGGSAETTFAPFLRSTAAAAAASGLSFASVEGNEFIDIPTGTTTANSFGASPGFQTNDPATFQILLDSVGPLTPYYGLNIATVGFYFLFWSGIVVDKAGFRIAAPETVVVNIDDGGSGTTYVPSGLVLGSTASRGYEPYFDPGTAEWDVSWAKTAAIKGDTSPVPIVSQIHQDSGQTLQAVAANVLAVKLSDSTFGF